MFDLIVAADPAIDRPIAADENLPDPFRERISRAPLAALQRVYGLARQHEARGVVLCGELLNPQRASPAQVVAVRQLVLAAAADGCETIVATPNPTTPRELLRMLGEPEGLAFATPLAPWRATIRAATVELWAVAGPADAERAVNQEMPAALHRRLLVGGDRQIGAAGWTLPAAVVSRPDTVCIWATADPAGLPESLLGLPPLQPRGRADQLPAGCCGLRLYQPPVAGDADGEPGTVDTISFRSVAAWQLLPAAAVDWQTVCIESAEGDSMAVAEQLWRAVEPLVPDPATPAAARPLRLIDCRIACGTSLERRIDVGAAAAATLERLRSRCQTATADVWCETVAADTAEPLAALGHSRSGGRPGASNSFTSALADIVTDREAGSRRRLADREAAWLALELLAAD